MWESFLALSLLEQVGIVTLSLISLSIIGSIIGGLVSMFVVFFGGSKILKFQKKLRKEIT